MRRMVVGFCIVLIVALATLFPRVTQDLPPETGTLVRKKYDTWSGVLRVWAAQTDAFAATGWLNACAASFEKQHNGVYIQIQSVDAEAVRRFAASGVNPPDMILFPSGTLDTADGLAAISEFSQMDNAISALRPGLAQCGTKDGACRAVPVAMGAYGWVYNRSLLDEIPPDWSDSEAVVQAAPDTAASSFSAALVCLCSASAAREGGSTAPYGIDLGLPAGTITPAPTAQAEVVLPCRLPGQFSVEVNAYTNFVDGAVAAIPASQQTLSQLSRLSGLGRGPDWALCVSGDVVFSDQQLWMSIVDLPREDLDARQTLCAEFLQELLSDAHQSELSAAGAFPVTGALAYSGQSGFSEMETALNALRVLAPNAFSSLWRSRAQQIAGRFASGSLSAREGLALLEAALRGSSASS